MTTDRPRRKWAEIQVDLFLDAARRQAGEGAQERFETLFRQLVPPIAPTRPQRIGRDPAPRPNGPRTEPGEG
jgi:hypothetical protein